MTQFQIPFDFSAPAEPVLLGLDAETVEALTNDSLAEIPIPEIIAGVTEPEQPPISQKPKCQILVVPEREAPRELNREYRISAPRRQHILGAWEGESTGRTLRRCGALFQASECRHFRCL